MSNELDRVISFEFDPATAVTAKPMLAMGYLTRAINRASIAGANLVLIALAGTKSYGLASTKSPPPRQARRPRHFATTTGSSHQTFASRANPTAIMDTPAAAAPHPASTAGAATHAKLNRQQRASLFAEAAKGASPVRKSGPEQELRGWRPIILEYYRRGYDAAQIQGFLASPKINVHVSIRALDRMVKDTTAPSPAAAKA